MFTALSLTDLANSKMALGGLGMPGLEPETRCQWVASRLTLVVSGRFITYCFLTASKLLISLTYPRPAIVLRNFSTRNIILLICRSLTKPFQIRPAKVFTLYPDLLSICLNFSSRTLRWFDNKAGLSLKIPSMN